MSNLIYKLSVPLLTVIAFATPVSAQSASIEIDSATRINRANELVRDGKYAAAIEGYREVRLAESTRDQLAHNLAVAQFRNGDVEAAKTLFSSSAASSDSSLAASSRYNLGNCCYTDAVKQAEQDKPAAIESLREAISHYRGSLAGNPNNADARANIELAVGLIQKLKEEQQQQEQQRQEQEQQQQEQQESSEQNQSERQKNDQQQQGDQNSDSQNTESEGQQTDNQDESNEQNQPDLQNPASDSNPQDEQSDQSESSEPNDNESEASQAKSSDDRPGEQSLRNQSANQSPEQPKPSKQHSTDQPSDEQSHHQTIPPRAGDQQQTDEPTSEEDRQAEVQAVPAGELTAADQQQVSNRTTGQVASGDADAKDGRMTKQEALKMLQAIRDRDMLRRLKQEQEQRSRHITVDRDW